MVAERGLLLAVGPSVDSPAACADGPVNFLQLYDLYGPFVWRTARRLGVSEGALEDVVQETFLVIHRRFDEPRAGSLRGWLYGIATRVVRNHRRSIRRKSPHLIDSEWTDPDKLAATVAGPLENIERAEAARALQALLATLDDDKREVFVLVELEQLSAPEVAEALGTNVNTVSSRLRVARAEFEQAARRLRARDEWRLR
jgi:RNA polymerase sigma-70 factor, ECF subfamily